MITVRFRCGVSSDDKSGQNESVSVPPSAVARPRLPSGVKNEGPAPERETDPSLKLERMQMVELKGIEPSTSSLRTTRSPS